MTKYLSIISDQLDGAMAALAESRTNADFGTPEFGQLIANIRELVFLKTDAVRMASIESGEANTPVEEKPAESGEINTPVEEKPAESGEEAPVVEKAPGTPGGKPLAEELTPMTHSEARAKLAKLRTAGKPVLEVMFGMFGKGTKLSDVPDERLRDLVKAVEEAE